MEKTKTSKFQEIKTTVSDAVQILRHFGTPGVLESLNKVKETATVVNGIMQSLQTPEMVRNIENFRLISENMNEVSARTQNTVQQIRETGAIDQAADLIKSAKGKINSFGEGSENSISGQDLRDVSYASKEMLVSIKDLMNELTVTIASSQKSGTIHNVKETINEASNLYKTTIA